MRPGRRSQAERAFSRWSPRPHLDDGGRQQQDLAHCCCTLRHSLAAGCSAAATVVVLAETLQTATHRGHSLPRALGAPTPLEQPLERVQLRRNVGTAMSTVCTGVSRCAGIRYLGVVRTGHGSHRSRLLCSCTPTASSDGRQLRRRPLPRNGRSHPFDWSTGRPLTRPDALEESIAAGFSTWTWKPLPTKFDLTGCQSAARTLCDLDQQWC